MALFDFMENFFFISLGITFGLILLLVYHFKQRISSVERRGDTMFDLLTNVVKELQFMKSLNSYYESVFQKSAVDTTESKSVPEIDVCLFRPPEKKVIDVPISKPAEMVVSKIPVSEDSESESESESESDSESELSELSDNGNETESDDESVDSEPEPEPEPEKIQIELGVEEVLTEPVEEVLAEEILPEPIKEVLAEEVLAEEVLAEEVLAEEVLAEDILPEPIKDVSVPVDQVFAEPTREQKRDIYRKMNITQLRGMATAAGIAGDLAKLKKAEIIKLLENLDE